MVALFDKTYVICCMALCIFLTSNSLWIYSCINCSSILAGISVTVIVHSSLSHPFSPSQVLGVFVVLQTIEISLFFQDLLNTDRSYSSSESWFKSNWNKLSGAVWFKMLNLGVTILFLPFLQMPGLCSGDNVSCNMVTLCARFRKIGSDNLVVFYIAFLQCYHIT